MYLLGYDIGSSSVKASLVNAESGKCVSSAFFPKTEAEIIAVKPGWAEQNPENWWEDYATRRLHCHEVERYNLHYRIRLVGRYVLGFQEQPGSGLPDEILWF